MNLKKIFVVSASLLLFFGGAQAEIPSVKSLSSPPNRVLYVGNSFFYYNNSMHGHVREMVADGAKDTKYNGVSVTISGSGLDWHDVASYLRPDGIGRYSFVAGNKVVFNPPQDKPFNAVVMMDCSQCPVHPTLSETFVKFARSHSKTVRDRGGQPVFFMSWAYQDAPEMTDQLAVAYTKTANENNALVIPAGLAFAQSSKSRPDINLYAKDKRHPSLEGTYLAAATTYVTLFGKRAADLKYTAGLPENVAQHLRLVADEAVARYLKPH